MDPQKARQNDPKPMFAERVKGRPNPNSASRCPKCLDRRIPDRKTFIKEIAAWEKYRNKHHTKADWQFTTDDARVKLKHLYSSIWMIQTTRFWRIDKGK
jgi:hypothetical protein